MAALASALVMFSLTARVAMTYALDVSSADSNWLVMMSCVCVCVAGSSPIVHSNVLWNLARY